MSAWLDKYFKHHSDKRFEDIERPTPVPIYKLNEQTMGWEWIVVAKDLSEAMEILHTLPKDSKYKLGGGYNVL